MRLLSALLLSALPLLASAPVGWEYDLAVAQKRAAKEGKLIFVDVWAEWCPPCQYLKTNIFPSAEAQQALGKVIPVSLLTETKDRRPLAENMGLAMRFKVEGYPTLLVLNAKGKELRRHVGAFSTGAQLSEWLTKK